MGYEGMSEDNTRQEYNEIEYSDMILDRFMATKWSEQERADTKALDLHDLPYLPLDLKISEKSLSKIIEAINSIDNKNFFYFCEVKVFPTNMEKLTFYGPEDYEKFFRDTKKAVDIESFESLQDFNQYKWQIDIPELKEFIESIPCNRLYAVESRNSLPGGQSPVHLDREKMFHGMHNRIWIPLNWPDGNMFKVTGLGDLHIEPGRPIVLNGNKFPHGTINKGSERRLALVVSADTHCDGFTDLLSRSHKKFLEKM